MKDAQAIPREAPPPSHGFAGMEVKTVKAIVAWIRTGQVPSEIGE